MANLNDMYGIPEDAMSDAPPEALVPGDQLAGLVRLLSRFGEIELPYREAERTAAGVHKLEKGALTKGLPLSPKITPKQLAELKKEIQRKGMDPERANATLLARVAELNEGYSPTGAYLKQAQERLEPRFVSGPFSGKSAAGVLADLPQSEGITAGGQMYGKQMGNANALREFIQNLSSTGRPSRTLSHLTGTSAGPTLHSILRELEENPAGPNMTDMILRNAHPGSKISQWTGPYVESIVNTPEYSSELKKIGLSPAVDRIKRAQESESFANRDLEEGDDRHWRPTATGFSSPGIDVGVTAGPEVAVRAGNGGYIPGMGVLAPTSPRASVALENLTGFDKLRKIPNYFVDANPGASAPGTAPIYGHLNESTFHDLMTPSTSSRMGDEEQLVRSMDPVAPFLSHVMATDPIQAQRIHAGMETAKQQGIMKGDVPSPFHLLQGDPRFGPMFNMLSPLQKSIPLADLERARNLPELLNYMNKNYGDFQDPGVILSSQEPGKRSINLNLPRLDEL